MEGTAIYSLIQDDWGNLLLSTDRGLIRYDGYEFRSFDNVRAKSRSLFGLCRATTGEIGCFNLNGQVFEFTEDSLRLVYELPDTLVSNAIVMGAGPDDSWLISCRRLVRLSRSGNLDILPAAPGRELGSEFLVMEDGSILFGEKFGGKIFRFIDGETVEIPVIGADVPASGNHQVHMQAHEGRVFLNYVGMFEVFELKGNQFELLPLTQGWDYPGNLHSGLFVGPGQNFWLRLVNGGLLPLNSGSGGEGPSIIFPDYQISEMLEDREHNLWFSTLNSGLILISNPNVLRMGKDWGAAGEKCEVMVGDGEGGVFMGTNQGQVVHLQADGTFKTLDRCGHGSIHHIRFFPASGKIGYGTVFRAYLYDLRSGDRTELGVRATTKGLFLKGEVIWVPSSDGLYVSMATGGEFPPEIRALKGFRWQEKNLAKIEGVGRSNCVAWEPEQGRLWVGTAVGLLSITSEAMAPVRWEGQPVFAQQIEPYESGYWVFDGKSGLFFIENGVVTQHVTPEDGLLKGNARNMKVVEPYLYLNYGRTIQVFNPETRFLRTMNQAEGLGEFNLRDLAVSDSMLWMASANGVQVMPKGGGQGNWVPPIIRITEFRVNGQKQPLTGLLRLKPEENQLEFSFAAAAFRHQGLMKYAYRLEGADQGWQYLPAHERHVRFNSLGPGKYTFSVRAINESGVESEPVSTTFVIAPPFWQRWWFILLCFASVAGLVALIFSIRIRVLKQQNQIRAEKQRVEKELVDSRLTALRSQMNPHFIFNSLNSIQGFILLNEKKLAAKYLNKFANLMRIYLNHSQKQSILLQEEIDALSIYLELEKVRFEDTLDYSVEVDPGLSLAGVSIPPFLIQPYVENAVKHGLLHKPDHRRLWVRISKKEAGIIQVEVEDNGIGRKKAAEITASANPKHQSYATSSTRNRLELLQQQGNPLAGMEIIDLTNAGGKACGTLVRLRIPIV